MKIHLNEYQLDGPVAGAIDTALDLQYETDSRDGVVKVDPHRLVELITDPAKQQRFLEALRKELDEYYPNWRIDGGTDPDDGV